MPDKTKDLEIVENLMEYIGSSNNPQPQSDLERLESKYDKHIHKSVDIFFNLGKKDLYNLSKTDLDPDIIFSLTQLIDFVRNPAPMYNKKIRAMSGSELLEYEEFKGLKELIDNVKEPEDLEEIKFKYCYIHCAELVDLITEIYIPALVSKGRKGRDEGKNVIAGINDKLKAFKDEAIQRGEQIIGIDK